MKNNTKKIENIFIGMGECLVPSGHKEIDLVSLGYLKERFSKINAEISLCTSKSQPYAELMLQILGLYNKKATHIHERGCRFNQVDSNKNFNFTNSKVESKIEEMLKRIEKKFSNSYEFVAEPGREVIVSLHLRFSNTSILVSECKKRLPKNWEKYFEIEWFPESLDIYPIGINKGSAIKTLDVKLYAALAIGASLRDMSMLKIVEYPACPSNACKEVKKLVKSKNGFVATHPDARGVVEILDYFRKKKLL